jgi:hypothetical protein
VRDRLPVTITKVIDNLVRDKDQIVKALGEVSPAHDKSILYYVKTSGEGKKTFFYYFSIQKKK